MTQKMVVCKFVYANLCQYGYGSKNGYGSLCGAPDVWNDRVTQMISNNFYLFKRVWIRGMDRGCGSSVWITCGSRVWIGTLHFELQPYLMAQYFHHSHSVRLPFWDILHDLSTAMNGRRLADDLKLVIETLAGFRQLHSPRHRPDKD